MIPPKYSVVTHTMLIEETHQPSINLKPYPLPSNKSSSSNRLHFAVAILSLTPFLRITCCSLQFIRLRHQARGFVCPKNLTIGESKVVLLPTQFKQTRPLFAISILTLFIQCPRVASSLMSSKHNVDPSSQLVILLYKIWQGCCQAG